MKLKKSPVCRGTGSLVTASWLWVYIRLSPCLKPGGNLNYKEVHIDQTIDGKLGVGWLIWFMAYLRENLEFVKSKKAVVSEVLVFAIEYALLASFEK